MLFHRFIAVVDGIVHQERIYTCYPVSTAYSPVGSQGIMVLARVFSGKGDSRYFRSPLSEKQLRKPPRLGVNKSLSLFSYSLRCFDW